MGKLTDIANVFELSVKEICAETGRSLPDLQRILESDSIIYPGELKELLTELLMMSYLETMAKRQGIHLGYNEDPFEF